MSDEARESLQEIGDDEIDLSIVREVPFHFLRNNLILPLRKVDDRLITAVADDRGLLAAAELARAFGARPETRRVRQDALAGAINRVYGQLGSAEEVMGNIAGEDLSSIAVEFERPRDILELTEEGPIIRLLNALFQQAVNDRASDIHIEPYEKELEVRMRVDGILHRVLSPPKIVQDALVSRVKIMAKLDIAEKRLPQDGRIRLLIGGRDIDVRVSIVPTTFGERAVLRLLDRSQGLLGLREIGLAGPEGERFSELLMRTNGIILVTGPTGSGKTTTLYAALNRVYSESKNIITVEDPVEYQLRGIGQIQVNPRIGLTFASGLRSILRQDPDVIMVGEIRDFDTAEIAVQASLTGHLVLSTLHTNDAPSALTRLIDMGVEPFLIASSLVAVLAQRLVRTLCTHCRERRQATEAETALLGPDIAEVYTSRGCDRCRGTGFHGRTGIFELLVIDDRVRQMITERQNAQTIKEYAVSRGLRTLFEEGIEKLSRGVTTFEEVLRVTQRDYAEF